MLSSQTMRRLLSIVLVSIWAGMLAPCWAVVEMPAKGISAHRGASTIRPENTLAAFRESIWQGAHQIEFDVDSSSDGNLVVIHDSTVNRTTNGSGSVNSLTLAQLRSLDAGSWFDAKYTNERIPTLAETLEMMPENVWLNVHMRGGYQNSYDTAMEIFAQNREHQAFMSVGTVQRQGALDAAIDAGKTILINNMQNQALGGSYVNETIAMGADFLQFLGSGQLPDPTDVQNLQAAGVRMNYCCVGSHFQNTKRQQLYDLFAAGVDYPMVDDIVDGVAAAQQVGVLPLAPQFQAAPTSAVLGANAIVNPGAEIWRNDDIIGRPHTTASLPTTSPLLTRDRELSGWIDMVEVTNVPYAASGVTPSVGNFPVSTFGKNAFTGGHSVGTRWIEQEIDLSNLVSIIDADSLGYNLSAWLGGQVSKTDYTSLWATFEDVNGVELDATRLTTFDPADWGSTTNLVEQSTSGTVPVGARSVSLRLLFNGQNGTTSGGLADNLSLIFTALSGSAAVVPEPSSLLLLAIGAFQLIGSRSNRNKNQCSMK